MGPMLDEDVKKFSRFIRARMAFFNQLRKQYLDKQKPKLCTYGLEKFTVTDWKTLYEEALLKRQYKNISPEDYESRIPSQFLLGVDKYWKRKSVNIEENAESKSSSLFTLSCYAVGRLQFKKQQCLDDYTDPAQLHKYREHMRVSIAWEYFAALFESHLHNPNMLLILGKICHDIGANYQAHNFIKSAWELSICPNTKTLAIFSIFFQNKSDAKYWIDYFGNSLCEKQNIRIETHKISKILDNDCTKIFFCYFITWAFSADRDDFVNSQISYALEYILADICVDIDNLRKRCSRSVEILLLCGRNSKKLKNIVDAHVYITLLICCLYICEQKDKTFLSYFVKCLCARDIVIKSAIDPIVSLFGQTNNVEKMRSCLIRNHINSLAFAVTSVLIEKQYYSKYKELSHNVSTNIPVNLSKLEEDYIQLEKTQASFLWRYETLIDSWVHASPSHTLKERTIPFTPDKDIYAQNTISSLTSYSNQQFLLPSTSPCPLTDFTPPNYGDFD